MNDAFEEPAASRELAAWRVVDATTVQRGDRVHLAGSHRRVVDMFALPRHGKHLVFEGGGTYRLAAGESLHAFRDPG